MKHRQAIVLLGISACLGSSFFFIVVQQWIEDSRIGITHSVESICETAPLAIYIALALRFFGKRIG